METKTKPCAIQETKKNDYLMLDPRNIEANEEFNVREDYGDMDWLIQDIREYGVKIPVLVHKKIGSDGIYILSDGFRRHRAAMVLINEGEPIRIKAICEPKGNTDENRLIDMFILPEGCKQLNAIEQAKVIGRLIAYGLEIKDIAVKIHKSQAYVSNLNQLNKAPTKLKKLISKNVIKATLVSEILRQTKDYDKAQDEIENAMTDKGITLEKDEPADNHENSHSDENEIIEEKEKKTPDKKKKVTKKDLQKKQGKVNSISHLKKFMKYFDKLQLKLELEENTTEKAIEELIPKEKQEIFSVLRGIYEGVITIDSLKELFDLAEEPVTEEK